MGAMHQHITYNEWLPVILGPRVLTIFELTLNPNGHYDRYNASVNPSVANAFAAAAFRFGHSLIKSREALTRTFFADFDGLEQAADCKRRFQVHRH